MYSCGLAGNNKMITWLPDLVQYNSNWDEYADVLYFEYTSTYRNGTPLKFNGKNVIAPSQPKFYGKSESFWHIIGGKDNIPEPKRCERIRWARAIIEHSDDTEVLVFPERRGRIKSMLLWLKEESYLVVLEERRKYFILRTAYVVEYTHKIAALEKLYLQSLQPETTG